MSFYPPNLFLPILPYLHQFIWPTDNGTTRIIYYSFSKLSQSETPGLNLEGFLWLTANQPQKPAYFPFQIFLEINLFLYLPTAYFLRVSVDGVRTGRQGVSDAFLVALGPLSMDVTISTSALSFYQQ